MKAILKTLILILTVSSTSFAQQGGVGIGTTSPDPSAILDLVSTEKGLLIPRMTTQQMMDIESPQEGLLIFDTEKKALCAYSTSTSWQILGLLPDGNPNDLLQLDANGKPFWAPFSGNIILDTLSLGLNGLIPAELVHIRDGNLRLDNGEIQSWGPITFQSDIDGSGDSKITFKGPSNTSKLVVDEYGNLGLGIDLPEDRLDIRSQSIDEASVLRFSNSDVSSFVRMSSGSNEGNLPFLNWQKGRDLIFSSANKDYTDWQQHLRMNTFQNGETQLVFGENKGIIDQFGNFGIGTLEPSNKLDVVSASPEDGAVFQVSNSDKSNFIRMFGGTTIDPSSWLNWQDGNPMIFSSANSDFSGWSEKMRISASGYLGVGTDSPTQALHVKGDAGLNDHVARIQNTNPDGSGLVIQIDGNHPMLIAGEFFPPKFPTPLEYLVQPIATKIKERIIDGEPFKAPTIDDFLDIVNGVIDPNAINMLSELGLDQLVLAAACDGTEYISSMVQFPDLDIAGVNSQLPTSIPNLPKFSTSSVALPNFPTSNLMSFQVPNGINTPSGLSPFDIPGIITAIVNLSLSYQTISIPYPNDLDNISIPAFSSWNNAVNNTNIDGDLDKFLNGFNILKNEMSSKFDAGSLLISDNLNCASVPNLSNIQLTLPKFDIEKAAGLVMDERNHFVTFVDRANRELGAIKAQHPADYLISQLSTNNVLEIAAIIPGIISDDGNIVENIVNLAGFGYQWVEGFNSIGVTYESSFGDYAEWLPQSNRSEDISYGDVVGIKGGFISRNLDGAEQVMVVSKAPIIMGNAPHPDSLSHGKNIAFIGQVPVKVMGPVKTGDFIVADADRFGFAKAISPDQMTPEDYKLTVGRSWDNNKGKGFKYVNTLVGMHNNAWANPMQKMQEQVENLESQMSSIVDRLENLENIKN